MAGFISRTVGNRARHLVATRPRLVLVAVFLVVLLASQGTVGAAEYTLDTSGGHTVDMGP